MIFQPSGGSGSGEGLTVYAGSLFNATPKTFETPVKLVFVSHNSDVPLWFIILPGESQHIYVAGDTWPPTTWISVELSANGKTLSTRSRETFLYYAIG